MNGTAETLVSGQVLPNLNDNWHKRLIGLTAVLAACFSSGFSGVYYEKLVKTGNQTSIVIRNLQLGVFSLIFGFSAVIFNDLDNIWNEGFLYGYTGIVWIIILLQVNWQQRESIKSEHFRFL